jgi:L-fuconolactonase
MIDAHVHLWRLGYNDCIWPTRAEGALYCDVVIEELLAVLDAAGVEQALLVQSQESPRDTAWLLEQAVASPRIAGVVGWADLRQVADIEALVRCPVIRGLRPMVQAYGADWYDDPMLDAGFARMAEAGLVLDGLIRPQHLPALARLARRHPALAIVIDHAAKPSAADPVGWHRAMVEVASLPHVHVKLSGLLTEMPAADTASFVAMLIDLFGVDRLIWGSDWPVLTQAGDYAGWLALARSLVPAAGHAAVFGGNAARLYRLREAAHA